MSNLPVYRLEANIDGEWRCISQFHVTDYPDYVDPYSAIMEDETVQTRVLEIQQPDE